MFNEFDDFEGHHFVPRPRGHGNAWMENLRAYSVAMMDRTERPEVNFGGKIILPQSALGQLTSLHIQYPMLFELSSALTPEKHTHAGVLEFIADEGRVYLPAWMMDTLLITEGDMIRVKNVSLPLGSFVKIQPQSVAFLDITDPKAVLENAFRNFSALTEGDVIRFQYNKKVFDIAVMETRPSGRGISIIETDLEVDFMAPIGYEEPKSMKSKLSASVLSSSVSSIDEHKVERDLASFRPFKGSGQRLNGKLADSPSAYGASYGSSPVASPFGQKPPSGSGALPNPSTAAAAAGSGSGVGVSSTNGRGPIPAALHLPFGKLFFGYETIIKTKADKNNPDAAATNTPESFTGQGQTLRASKKGNAGPSSSSGAGPSSSK
ncbi:hypothetical protein SmJEL517_g06256 [Synchytrium microbalum]|uniref:Ubiquitin fusion degradation protein UFD1 n=1 Tax=Synchytrium microbalum TaxID=1806994 RepID=A0A507BJB8_9FUNG|nr:uncharacterized protein SmJEL517_g06256 [Synchytrium microbalum]TPX30107.1 hypothetical protein SmJEL517_g06256 [Synchytrium microbalum]